MCKTVHPTYAGPIGTIRIQNTLALATTKVLPALLPLRKLPPVTQCVTYLGISYQVMALGSLAATTTNLSIHTIGFHALMRR